MGKFSFTVHYDPRKPGDLNKHFRAILNVIPKGSLIEIDEGRYRLFVEVLKPVLCQGE